MNVKIVKIISGEELIGEYDEETTTLLTMASDKGEMFFVSIHALGNSRKRADITILDSEGKTI